jgi:aminobenzoyl-glutamate utilization protein B
MTAHGNTEIAHKAMLTAGKVLALAGIRVFEDPEIAVRAREEWMEDTKGEYNCPIPKEIGPRLDM